jgi:hypothetical protein
MSRRRVSALAALVVGLLSSGSPPAHAGVYEVRACHSDGVNNSWWTYASNGFATAYVQCPGGVLIGGHMNEGMIARNTGGPGQAPSFSHAMVQFQSPPGARVVRVRGQIMHNGTGGWQSGMHDRELNRWIWCGPTCLSSFGWWLNFDVGGLSTTRIAALTVCGASACARDGLHGVAAIKDVTVSIADEGAPSVALKGGSLLGGGWRRGTHDVVVEAWDHVGIRRKEVHVDGTLKAARESACDDTLPVPCPNGTDSMSIDTAQLSDGRHTITAQAIDAANNVAATHAELSVDNTPPARPQGLAIERGAGWQARNSYALAWTNPPQNGTAPIAGIEYALCPHTNRPDDFAGCAQGARSGNGITRIEDLTVPGTGTWVARFWLRDAAGNADPRTAAEATLRLDRDAPTLAFETPDPDDPARITVRATDATSGIAEASIEASRRGDGAWIPLPVQPVPGGFSTVPDDETLPEGTYELRARAVDHAGNERSSDRRLDGEPATIALPARVRTRLAVGRVRRVRARGSRRGRPRYRRVLVVRPRSVFGRTVRLSGRLTTPGANPLAGRDVEVFEQVKLPGAPWRRIATVTTSPTGRFTFRALRGPARILRFRFPGTRTIGARSTEVELRVRAATSMRPSRHSVVNGEEVTFRGRLRGGPLPRPGKLVELQAFARGRWLTFATPRANPVTGIWAHRYRFAATRGRVRYRFRARVPKEVGYPYETGASRSVRVIVRGL